MHKVQQRSAGARSGEDECTWIATFYINRGISFVAIALAYLPKAAIALPDPTIRDVTSKSQGASLMRTSIVILSELVISFGPGL